MGFLSIYIIWFVIMFLEILRNWSIIAVHNRRPTYWWSQVIRIVISGIYWVIVGKVATITQMQCYAMPIMMVFTFWFTFDYGLNQFRNMMYHFILKPGYTPIHYYYLNPEGSWLDKFQCNNPNTFVWFVFKLFLMSGSIAWFQYGLDAAWYPKW